MRSSSSWRLVFAVLAPAVGALVACGGSSAPAPGQPGQPGQPGLPGQQGSPPTLTAVLPTGSSTAGGTVVTITGTNLSSGTKVFFGDVPGVSPVANNIGTSVAVTAPAHVAGPVDLKVTDVFGQSATLPGAFTFGGSGPVITSLNVRGCPPAGGTMISIKGLNLQSGAAVTIGGVASTGPVLDAAQQILTVTTPPQPAGGPEFVPLVVTNPDNQSATFANFHIGPRPNPTSVVDLSGPALSAVRAGDTLSIRGTSFRPDVAGLQVQIGVFVTLVGTPTATEIQVTAPGLNGGATEQVVVTNFDGQFGIAPAPLTFP